MYLKMIAVEASNRITLPAVPVFRWTAHHVKEIVLALLPPKFTLDGSSKIQVTCGPRGDEPQYRRTFGTAHYFREDFDFQRYYELTPLERDQMLLQVLEESFLDIATSVDVGAEVRDAISTTAKKVRACGFNLVLRSQNLSRCTPCRRLTVHVYRMLNREVGEVWSCKVRDRDGRLVHTELMGESPHYLDLTDFYKLSRWKGSVFEVQSRLGKSVYELDVSPFLGA